MSGGVRAVHLVLSPHFDDGVLSCGGTIFRLAQQGENVTVLTVMGGAPAALPDTPIVRELHARWQAGDDTVAARRLEDRVAVTSLGASVDDLPIPDCIYRTFSGQGLYPDEGAIFGDIHPQDDAANLMDYVVVKPDMTLVAPLGVGHHVDHQIVRDWALALNARTPPLVLKFYEEYPYTRDPAAAEKALNLLNACAPGLRLALEIATLTEAEVEAKIHAIACYRSQVSSFWESLDAMAQQVRQSMLEAGKRVYAERFWRVVE